MREYNVEILIEALPYIRKFQNQLFVVKLGGGLLKDRGLLENIAHGLTLLHMVGIRLIVVHGGGPQVNEMSETLGLETTIVAGRRVTSDETLEVAKMVFAGKLNTEFISALQKSGSLAVGLSGIDSGLIQARRRPVTRVVEDGQELEVDFGHVGDVLGVEPRLLKHLVADQFIPVVNSLAADPEGAILNINADTIASEIAVAMGAHKLILLSGIPGVFRKPPRQAEIYPQLSLTEVEELLHDGTARSGMKPKLQACIRALRGGVPAAHILNGKDQHSLLKEIFTDMGVGTMIVPLDSDKR